jgi:hypothetical protein
LVVVVYSRIAVVRICVLFGRSKFLTAMKIDHDCHDVKDKEGGMFFSDPVDVRTVSLKTRNNEKQRVCELVTVRIFGFLVLLLLTLTTTSILRCEVVHLRSMERERVLRALL